MMFETTIIRGNKQIKNFEISPNEKLDLYLRGHERGKGGDDWFDISNLTKKEVEIIKGYCKSQEEKDAFNNLQEGDTIDILLHFYVYING